MGQVSEQYAASLDTVQEAAGRIAEFAHRTPVQTCSALDALCRRQLFFKCEIFQRTGAFKFRGACNAVQALSQQDAQKGVVTHSSGNHGGALALAAKLRGITAHVVVPHDTPLCKIKAIEGYGAHVVKCDSSMDAREAKVAEVQAATGAVLIPPYNHPHVISGQGTMALELLEQVTDLDAIVIPVSGGGMLSGVATVVKALRPNIIVVAAEPTGNNDAADVTRSLAAGQLVSCPKPDTIADGLRGRMGDLTWPIIRDKVDAALTVSEAEIVDAMRMVFERMKLVLEPSGAVGLAAVLSEQFGAHPRLQGCRRVGVILCGGNVDVGERMLNVLVAQTTKPAA